MSNEISPDRNLQVYSSPKTVSYYGRLSYLTKCEQHLFETYIKPGMKLLDIGVGGGRTTPYLTAIADRYVGIDYAEGMIKLCKAKFPSEEFLIVDASNLSMFEDGSFDAVVFSFNGLDYLYPNEKRLAFLLECFRVLKEQGVFIFSVHNAKAIFVRPHLHGLSWIRTAYWMLYTILASARLMIHRLPRSAFWRGEGCILDPVHGGLLTHVATPENVVDELNRSGFTPMEILGCDYPGKNSTYATSWYYYAFAKVEHRDQRLQTV